MTAYHLFPGFQQALSTKTVNLQGGTVDTLKVGLVATGTFNWVAATQAYTTVSQFLTNAGSGGGTALTESAVSGYARQTLTSVGCTTSGEVTTLTCATPQWGSVGVPITLTTVYAFFYDYTAGGNSDTAGIMVCYWDLGGAQSLTNGIFQLQINASGLITWTAS